MEELGFKVAQVYYVILKIGAVTHIIFLNINM